MPETAKVIELMGSSTESWEDAAQNALDDADETLKNITEIEITSQTASVEAGRIQEYETKMHISFALDR
jgi:flavin-binding protein dodecin